MLAKPSVFRNKLWYILVWNRVSKALSIHLKILVARSGRMVYAYVKLNDIFQVKVTYLLHNYSSWTKPISAQCLEFLTEWKVSLGNTANTPLPKNLIEVYPTSHSENDLLYYWTEDVKNGKENVHWNRGGGDWQREPIFWPNATPPPPSSSPVIGLNKSLPYLESRWERKRIRNCQWIKQFLTFHWDEDVFTFHRRVLSDCFPP